MIISLQNSYADGLLFQALAERLGTRLIVFSRILKPWGNSAEKDFHANGHDWVNGNPMVKTSLWQLAAALASLHLPTS